MKILNINETLELARRAELPDYEAHEQAILAAADALAKAVASHMGIVAGKTTSEELDMDGVCTSFGAAYAGQEQPKEFDGEDDEDRLDEGGDWEYHEEVNLAD